jgi:hypothetical protein
MLSCAPSNIYSNALVCIEVNDVHELEGRKVTYKL